ncbi:MAG: beta-eliminating lyase-related protein [Rhodobacteraceae bacterium]|nr:beta-eliminating lyase-related protein [Paracoccaceae bacterium]
MNFGSDNCGPAPSEIIASIVEANKGYQSSYGSDSLMDEVKSHFKNLFEHPDLSVYLVATGTAANALSLACICPPWGTIFCHQESHIQVDECGAPEFFSGGAKLTLLEGHHGKIDPIKLSQTVANTGVLGVHNVQKGALALTNTTELGTVYTLAELNELTSIAKNNHMQTHLDGARFANALIKLGCSPADLSWKAGVDILTFGGTKNGLLGVEAVVIFDPKLAWEFELRRKRAGHLFSKHRYLSAQMLRYLSDGLWVRLAEKANQAARKLADGLAANPSAEIKHPVDANMIFVNLPRATHKKAFVNGAAYHLWPPNQSLGGDDQEPLLSRLVCNWFTTDTEINSLLAVVSSE